MRITDLFAPFPDELQLAATPSVSNPPRVEWTSAWGDLFFRIKGADPQILWCVLGRGAPAKRPLSKARLATLNKYISAAYAGRTFFRVVPFADGDDWALVRPKRALVKSPTQRKGAIWQWRANFQTENGEIDWLSQPLSWFENWLAENADEPLQSAREFARWNDDQRTWRPICHDAMARARWEALLPALQKLSCHFFHRTPVTWDLGVVATNLSIGWKPFGTYQHKPAPAMWDCFDLLWQYHPLQPQHELWRGIGVRGKKAKHVAPSCQSAEPTQHEKIEAALLWRDFGREIGESARVETALAELMSV